MKRPSARETAALADLTNPGHAETHREHCWHLMSITDRERVCGIAGFTREKAHMPLAFFTDAERERVRLAITAHIAQMEWAFQCMAPRNTNVHGYLH